MSPRLLLLTLILVLTFAVRLEAQTTAPAQPAASQTTAPQIKKVPAGYTDPSSGEAMYKAYCASCHGVDGRGEGPAASALRVRPTNLMMLTAKNKGVFPAAHIAEIIKGDNLTAAHGNKEMPVWGPVFLRLSKSDPAQMQLRIRNLTKYLESIQQ